MKKNTNTPRYIRIAVDIAYRIVNCNLKEGSRISGRSILAGEYNVSPETIRRSIALLKDMAVVHVADKSGIVILSREQAKLFIEKFRVKDNFSKLKKELLDLMEQKRQIDLIIEGNLNEIMEHTIEARNIGLINPFELVVPQNSPIIGKTIAELKFWQNTDATIIGVRRDSEILISPGPYLDFREQDTIFFIGKDETFENVKLFITEKS